MDDDGFFIPLEKSRKCMCSFLKKKMISLNPVLYMLNLHKLCFIKLRDLIFMHGKEIAPEI